VRAIAVYVVSLMGEPDEVRRDEEVLRAYLGRNAQASTAGVG